MDQEKFEKGKTIQRKIEELKYTKQGLVSILAAQSKTCRLTANTKTRGFKIEVFIPVTVDIEEAITRYCDNLESEIGALEKEFNSL